MTDKRPAPAKNKLASNRKKPVRKDFAGSAPCDTAMRLWLERDRPDVENRETGENK